MGSPSESGQKILDIQDYITEHGGVQLPEDIKDYPEGVRQLVASNVTAVLRIRELEDFLPQGVGTQKAAEFREVILGDDLFKGVPNSASDKQYIKEVLSY